MTASKPIPPGSKAACRGAAPVDGTADGPAGVHLWFPTRRSGADNHAATAKDICRTCPVREQCLLYAVTLNIDDGVWGGTGEAERRWIRRAWVADGREPGPQYRLAAGRWFLELDQPGTQQVPNRNGAGATHGRRSTFARGCRCESCTVATSFDGVVKTLTRKTNARKATAA